MENEKIKLKTTSNLKNINSLKSKKNIIYIIFFILLFIFSIIVSFLLYIKIRNLKLKIIEKDNEIEKERNEINNLKLKQNSLKSKKTEIIFEAKNRIEKEFLYDYNYYITNNMNSSKGLNSLEYSLVITGHTLEKGFTHFNLRPFGINKIKKLIYLLKKETKYEKHEKLFSFINGINLLKEYKKIYEINNWTNYSEYKEVSDFINEYKDIEIIKAGAYIVEKVELEKDYKIDYKKFIKSRHSTRNFKKKRLKKEDILSAVEMAKYTPSACNRQNIKLHYYPSGKMKQNVIDFSLGKGGIYLSGVSTFIITIDVNGLFGAGERNQGYFNAGLFATNLINAFHSLGIGTCLIQFSNKIEEEEELKKLNQIPSYERIAVILFAGYYDEKSIFAVSSRKSVEEYFKEHI